MTNSGDSAEQIVRLSLNGVEVMAKITGETAKSIGVLLYTIMKNKTQTAGKTRLTNMLKTGKELKIFSIKAQDLQKFKDKAKEYGILYCALIDRKNKNSDGMVDVMVKAEDASRINRIIERFKLATIDTAKIKTEIGKIKVNPKSALMDKENLSKHTSKNNGVTKPSVKKELDKITKEMKLEGKIPVLTQDKKKGVQVK
ncbi:MAG: PcfB family protein [Oscillospiraceae bacterium]|nr:PcfB family protein [Oscillospiraceae bacterium]